MACKRKVSRCLVNFFTWHVTQCAPARPPARLPYFEYLRWINYCVDLFSSIITWTLQNPWNTPCWILIMHLWALEWNEGSVLLHIIFDNYFANNWLNCCFRWFSKNHVLTLLFLRFRSALINDFVEAITAVHEQFDWPFPIVTTSVDDEQDMKQSTDLQQGKCEQGFRFPPTNFQDFYFFLLAFSNHLKWLFLCRFQFIAQYCWGLKVLYAA